MNIPRARRELDALERIMAARAEWVRAARAITNFGNGFMGPQGVSSNTEFDIAAAKLFDGHVAHLIANHKAAFFVALDDDA